MKLVDKAAIVTEIERIKKEECPIDTYEGRIKLFYFEQFLSFINTLEVKEEILDEKGKTDLMQKCVKAAYKRGYDMGVLQTTNKMKHNTKEVDLEKEFDKCCENYIFNDLYALYTARRFFELGFKAKRG